MKFNAIYKILPQYQLIIEYLYGKVSINDGRLMKQMEISDNDYNPDYSFLVDIRNCNLEVSNNDLVDYIRYVRSISEDVHHRKSAIITNTPEQVAYAMLYCEMGKGLKTNWKIFSTYKSAVQWLGIAEFSETEYSSYMNTIVKK